MSDPDSIGPDGSVRLHAYLPLADTTWLAAGCTSCGRDRPISIPAAIAAMGSGEATVRQLAQRLRCTGCGGRRVQIIIATDPRSQAAREREGLLAEVWAGLPP